MADRATVGAISNALKTVAVPRQETQYNNAGFTLKKIKRSSETISLNGRQIELSLKTAGTPSWRTMDEMESLPQAGTPAYKLALLPVKTAAGQFQISKLAMEAAKGKMAAWIETQSELMSDMVEQFAQRMNQMLFRNGSGAVAKVKGTPPSTTTINLYDDQESGGDGLYGLKYLQEGMQLSASANLTSGDKAAELFFNGRITIMDDTNIRLTVDPAFVVANLPTLSYLFIGTQNGTSKNRDFMGLTGICDNGTGLATLQNIDRTASGNSFWKGNRYDSVGITDLENKFKVAADDISRRVQGKIDAIVTSYGVYRRFTNSIIPGRRFVAAAESQNYKTGVSELTWAASPNRQIPVEVDKDCPKQTAFLLDTSTIRLGTLGGGPQWLDDEGSILKWDQGLLGYTAVYYQFGEFLTTKPAANAILLGITED